MFFLGWASASEEPVPGLANPVLGSAPSLANPVRGSEEPVRGLVNLARGSANSVRGFENPAGGSANPARRSTNPVRAFATPARSPKETPEMGGAGAGILGETCYNRHQTGPQSTLERAVA